MQREEEIFINQLNGYQIFIHSEDLKQIVQGISKYVKRFGCAAYLNIHSDKPSPILSKRQKRTFRLSAARNGFVCIWEDGSWADKKLALQLSKELSAEVIWLMISSATETWGYIKYKNGKQENILVETSENYLERAQEFAKQNALPYAFVYFPDPNLAELAAKLKARHREKPVRKKGASLENLEVEVVNETNGQEDNRDTAENNIVVPEGVAKSDEETETEVPHFVEKIFPCKSKS